MSDNKIWPPPPERQFVASHSPITEKNSYLVGIMAGFILQFAVMLAFILIVAWRQHSLAFLQMNIFGLQAPIGFMLGLALSCVCPVVLFFATCPHIPKTAYGLLFGASFGMYLFILVPHLFLP